MDLLKGFFGDGALIPVLVIVLIIWFGISAYLLYIDSKIKKLEKKFDNDSI